VAAARESVCYLLLLLSLWFCHKFVATAVAWASRFARLGFHTYVARLARRSCFDGMAAIMERRRALTTSDDLKIFATSGSSTTATVPLDIFAANRFGCDLL